VESGTNIYGPPPTEGKPGMNRSVSAAIIAMALVACCSLAWAAPPQGYQSRACGFDLNFNGVPGEPGDCNRICRGDPTNTDIDGNGVADRQVYVNCSAGTDSTTCGAPGSPCRTLQYALNGSNSRFADHISSPATNQIQAVCFQGICGNAQVNLTQSGAAGTYTRTASGSEPRSFEFPRYPVIISGWDVNADGNYPPNSGETAVVDGNVNGNTNTFFNSGGHSRYELAHFTIRDYGQACTGGVGVGDPGGTTDVSHAYWHDLAVIDVNRGCNQGEPASQSGQILWNNFTGDGNTLRYFAVVNTSIQNWGGYIFRGSSPSDDLTPSETSGPYRFQNVTATALPANGSSVFGFKPWSTISGFDLIDSIIDANTDAYSPGDPTAHYAITIAQCVQDIVIRNNQLKNWKQSIVLQPSASGYCPVRDLNNIIIDGNEIRNTYSSWSQYGHTGIRLDANNGSSSQVAQNVTITNNFISSTNVRWASAVQSENSRDTGTITGILRIAGNTIEANGASCNFGLIGLCTNGTCRGQRQNNIQILGNILRGCQAGAAAVKVAYAPSGFAADWNLYDVDGTANWVWNGSTRATLASWQTALGGCPAANHDCGARQCVPGYVSASSGNYHLQNMDTCARDAGFSLAGILDTDIDEQPRPGGASWDMGADEVVLSGTSPPAAPRLLDVEPLGP
jgi:hypothetical protein